MKLRQKNIQNYPRECVCAGRCVLPSSPCYNIYNQKAKRSLGVQFEPDVTSTTHYDAQLPKIKQRNIIKKRCSHSRRIGLSRCSPNSLVRSVARRRCGRICLLYAVTHNVMLVRRTYTTPIMLEIKLLLMLMVPLLWPKRIPSTPTDTKFVFRVWRGIFSSSIFFTQIEFSQRPTHRAHSPVWINWT